MPNHMSIDMIHNQNGYPTTPAMFGFANNHIKVSFNRQFRTSGHKTNNYMKKLQAIPNGLNERHHPSWNSGGFCDKVEVTWNAFMFTLKRKLKHVILII